MGKFKNMAIEQINFEEEVRQLSVPEKLRMTVALLADLNEKENSEAIKASATFIEPIVGHTKKLVEELDNKIQGVM